jgi:hypothetical protein
MFFEKKIIFAQKGDDITRFDGIPQKNSCITVVLIFLIVLNLAILYSRVRAGKESNLLPVRWKR